MEKQQLQTHGEMEGRYFKLKMLIIVVAIFIFQSCNNKYSKSFKIEEKDSLSINVTKFDMDHGVIRLNRKHLLFSASHLVDNKSYPNWLKPKHKPLFVLPGGKKYTPSIGDVVPPYKLYKYKGDDFFYVVKYNDTLKFKLVWPE